MFTFCLFTLPKIETLTKIFHEMIYFTHKNCFIGLNTYNDNINICIDKNIIKLFTDLNLLL